MINSAKFFLMLMFVVFAVSCDQARTVNNNKNFSETKETTNSSSIDNTDSLENSTEEIYRLVVSFYSTGSGINQEALKKFQNHIIANYIRIVYDKVSWGREGEIDYCFHMAEQNEKEQKWFIDGAKEVLADAKNVIISENAPCKHKNQKQE